jgi:anti-sigma B factor antagonist
MKLLCEEHGEVSVLHVTGEFAGDEVERFHQLAQQRIERNQARDFVIDCSAVEFIDSRGIEALIWLQDRCAEQLGQMRLAGCSEQVRTVLEITRLIPRFECHAAVDAAVKSLK